MPNRTIQRLMIAAGLDPTQCDEAMVRRIEELMHTIPNDPMAAVVEVLRAWAERDHAKRCCRDAAEAATKLEEMIQKMLEGNSLLCRLEAIRETPSGPRAVCRISAALHELSIHPEVDVDALRSVKPWEYVAVHEQVVVGYWKDDPALYANAHGEVVEFKGYADRALGLVRVARTGEERIAVLDPSVADMELTPHTRLILQRDDPSRVIAVVAAQEAQSRFEVPASAMTTRLQDLAGVAEVAEQLIQDILLRVYFGDIRDRFDLEPLRGILLYSYKPGMGKTALVRAIARFLYDHRETLGADVVLYVVKPNETKSMWHGEDARIVREELWGAIRARQALPRSRPLIQLIAMDELDSMGQRAGRDERVLSAAQSDAVEAMLHEMDGMLQQQPNGGPPAHVLVLGMTNRPDRVDDAMKRPGRFDVILPMPDVDPQTAEDVMAIYARSQNLPWYLEGEVKSEVAMQIVRSQFLRPAVARFFSAVVLRYRSEGQRSFDVTAGEILSNAHLKAVVNRAKRAAAVRAMTGTGIPAITQDDLMDAMLDVCIECARQMEADPRMLVRQLDIKVPVSEVRTVPRRQLEEHRYLRLSA